MEKILIPGAGMAGPVLGYWLARSGRSVTIVERASGVRRGGYAIDVRGPALLVAERMGVLERMRQESTDTLSTTFINEQCRPVATFDRGFGVISPQDVEIMRGDLASILYEATRADVRYLFDDSIRALSQDDAGVDVAFESSPPERFDLVLGCDGLHSNVRALTTGVEAPLLRQLGSAIAIFTARNHPALERGQLMMMAPHRVASIKSDRGNASVKVTLIFSSPPIDRRDPAAPLQAVRNAFAHLGGWLPALLADLDEAPDFYFDMTAQARLPAWHSGRVGLVGDAAFGPSPMTGQGTSLAMIGAYVLAQTIAELGAGPKAFVAYEARLRPFVERNQDVALGVAKGFAPTTALGAWFRNVNMRVLPYLPWKNFVFELMMGDIRRAADAFGLERPQSMEPGAA